MHLRAVGQPGGQDQPDQAAGQQRQHTAEEGHAVGVRARIADEQIGHQRGNTCREQEDVALRTGVDLPDQADDQRARKAEPDVQHRDAPEGEARRQEERQHRHAVRLAARQGIDRRADRADERNI